MAIPPTIPTSFVPHSASVGARSFRADVSDLFGIVAYLILGIVFLGALGVFFYGRILVATQSAKDAALAKVEAAIDPVTVEGFVRLRDRLTSGTTLLNGHGAPSLFFTALGTVLPATVRFTALHLSLGAAGAVKLDGTGIAKNFNALAAVSAAFAADGRIKDAIFSNIVVRAADNSVSFVLSAVLDPKLVAFTP